MTVIQNSTTYFSITVLDLPNLDPRFLNEPYSGSVSENSPLVRSPPGPAAWGWGCPRVLPSPPCPYRASPC